MTHTRLFCDTMDADTAQMQTVIDADADFTNHTWQNNSGIFDYGGITWDYTKTAGKPEQSCYSCDPQSDPTGQQWRDIQLALITLGAYFYAAVTTQQGWIDFKIELDAIPPAPNSTSPTGDLTQGPI